MRIKRYDRKQTNCPDLARTEGRANGILPNKKDGDGPCHGGQIECYPSGGDEVEHATCGYGVQRNEGFLISGWYDDKAARLDVIYRIMNKEVFGIRKAAKMVGGRVRLERLIIEGRIRAEKGNRNAQNGKWLINAADVLRFARI